MYSHGKIGVNYNMSTSFHKSYIKQAHTRMSGGHWRWQVKIVSQRNLFVKVEISVMRRKITLQNCSTEMQHRIKAQNVSTEFQHCVKLQSLNEF